MTSRQSAFGLAIVGVLMGLLSLEILLRLYVTVAGYPGEETRGWRNASVLGQADIVAIGDSQTYGYNVQVDAAWPQQLGRILNRSAYQLAHGGWGPANYLLALDEALALKPKAIVVGFYLGNDLADAFARVYRTAHFADASPDHRLDAFTSTDPKVRDMFQRAEGIDPGFHQWSVLRCDPEGRMVKPAPRLQPMGERLAALVPAPHNAGRAGSPRGGPDRLRESIGPLLRTSVVYRTMRVALARVWRPAARGSGPEDYGSPICVHFHDRQMQTVLAAAERLALLDKTDPRIAEGERISFAIFRDMAERCRRAGVRFYVLVIPTKESVFRARAEAVMGGEPYLRGEWDAEARVRSEALTFFREAGVDAIDPLPGLQAVVALGVNPYPVTFEPHPIAAGYEAIARAVATRLRHDGF